MGNISNDNIVFHRKECPWHGDNLPMDYLTVLILIPCKQGLFSRKTAVIKWWIKSENQFLVDINYLFFWSTGSVSLRAEIV